MIPRGPKQWFQMPHYRLEDEVIGPYGLVTWQGWNGYTTWVHEVHSWKTEPTTSNIGPILYFDLHEKDAPTNISLRCDTKWFAYMDDWDASSYLTLECSTNSKNWYRASFRLKRKIIKTKDSVDYMWAHIWAEDPIPKAVHWRLVADKDKFSSTFGDNEWHVTEVRVLNEFSYRKGVELFQYKYPYSERGSCHPKMFATGYDVAVVTRDYFQDYNYRIRDWKQSYHRTHEDDVSATSCVGVVSIDTGYEVNYIDRWTLEGVHEVESITDENWPTGQKYGAVWFKDVPHLGVEVSSFDKGVPSGFAYKSRLDTLDVLFWFDGNPRVDRYESLHLLVPSVDSQIRVKTNPNTFPASINGKEITLQKQTYEATSFIGLDLSKLNAVIGEYIGDGNPKGITPALPDSAYLAMVIVFCLDDPQYMQIGARTGKSNALDVSWKTFGVYDYLVQNGYTYKYIALGVM